MSTYYNEHDKYASAWLGNLMQAGLISAGKVDDQDIQSINSSSLAAYDRVHLFAGIAGWELALKLAGWPEELEVWTGSCPCQPYSIAGKQQGVKDERDLWPWMLGLIAARRPQFVFGEQVENAVGHGWWDRVSADLEGEGYEVGAAVLGAHSVGAPHIRQRLYWMAYTPFEQALPTNQSRFQTELSGSRSVSGMADTQCNSGRAGRITDESGESTGTTETGSSVEFGRLCDVSTGGKGNPDDERSQGRSIGGNSSDQRASGPTSLGAWDRYDVIPCADGKARRIESGTFPLAHGVPARVGKLRAYGNAIVPQVATEFIKAFLDIVAI